MEKDGYEGLREQLEMLEWPAIYMYKFIVPLAGLDELLAMFEKEDTRTKISKNGNYASVTAKPYMYSVEKVIDRYKRASEIDGIIML